MTVPGPPPGPPLPPHEPAKPKRRLTPGQIVGIVLIILALVFIFENTRDVKVRIIIPEVTAPLWVALLIAAAAGVLGTMLIQWRRGRRKE